MRSVLITGSSGFLGSKLCELFYKKGYFVIGWDCYNRFKEYIKFCSVNMMDYEIVVTNLKEMSPDIIVHCAGSADVGKSMIKPIDDYCRNVTITHNLLFAVHELGLKNVRIIYLSSAGVYGNSAELPIAETASLNPLSPYALHKLMCENICQYFIKNYEMDIKIARVFSAYGQGLKKQIFWDMFNKARINRKLDMIGTGYESRDYIHVDDVVQALYLIATVSSNDVVFNVANGEEITIRSVTEIFAKYYGIAKSEINFNGVVREGDPLNWRADISRIKKIGYRKRVLIEEGIYDYINWALTERSSL